MNIIRILSSGNLKVILYFTFLAYALFLILVFSVVDFNNLLSSTERLTQRVFIVGKAAIGQYLWEHLFRGNVEYFSNGFYKIGNKTLHNINFIYLSGPGYIQSTIPQEIEYMVLVLNGRDYKKVEKAREWLDYLPSMKFLKKVAVVLLGDEKCENEWIVSYMKSKGGIIDILFLVYDAPIIDNKEIFQWPLGVATYRGFPHIKRQNLRYITKERQFRCNFMGTVYRNSSREILNSSLRSSSLKNKCYLQARDTWIPEETSASLKSYIEILQDSDLTLSPVGVNTECYRIYEAMSLGSVPVIEDVMTQGKCVSPLRLLKKYNAPVIYVNNWNNLGKILSDENMNLNSIVDHRKKILYWYYSFKNSITLHFIAKLKSIFFV